MPQIVVPTVVADVALMELQVTRKVIGTNTPKDEGHTQDGAGVWRQGYRGAAAVYAFDNESYITAMNLLGTDRHRGQTVLCYPNTIRKKVEEAIKLAQEMKEAGVIYSRKERTKFKKNRL